MKRGTFTLVGFLIAMIIGVAIGYLGARNNLFERGLSDHSADAKPAEAAADWQEWKYPGSREHDASTWGGGLAGNARMPGHYGVVMTTQDDYAKVPEFYADKGVPALGSGSGMKVSADGNTNSIEDWFVLNDSLTAEGVNQSRSIKAKMCAKRTLLYDLTLFVSRADNEKHTHIVLVYYPRQQ